MIQNSNLYIARARRLFDGAIENLPETESKLSSTADIVHTPIFELAVVKIQNGTQEELIEEEKLAVNFILRNIPMPNSIQELKDIKSSSFAERLSKRRKLGDWEPMYIDTRFIIPTTNISEPFFSKAGYSLGKRCKSINPEKFDSQMFPDINYDFWDKNYVNLVMK